MIHVAIKENIYGGDHYCALCGEKIHTKFGPDLFLEGTNHIICHDCGRDHNPMLVEFLELMDKAGSRLANVA
ncbi:hypothetical protein [Desulforhabdus amnigena]|jgi:hypothetical protein|uniref:Uncharacterized protein n=1 Tax=Desulforhabdus amnigena TaxID=40218 RepID=A0A9W6D093_9BACT|nr:hypothetical protein [Desulforhabdus amnigena]NLJ27260.1 hypothetical protein [Deltaproteobacteria bacterium]GLI32908.1 hypothetical protein DAMNIGENAA_03410 [Desulforhabdus amnigena]